MSDLDKRALAIDIRQELVNAIKEERDFAADCQKVCTTDMARQMLYFELIAYQASILAVENCELHHLLDA